MPKLTNSFFADGRQLSINDPKGSPVMRAAFMGSRRNTTTPSGEGSRLILSDMSNEVLAYCQDDKARSVGGYIVISINSSQGVYATFQPVGSGSYEVVGRRPWKLTLVRRSLPGGSGLAVLDEAGQLLAVCEPSDEDTSIRVVRIDANMDAGLVILCLLCTDVAEIAA